MSDNTYGSFGLHCGRLLDIKGEHINKDTLTFTYLRLLDKFS